MMNEAQPSNLLFYWEVRFLPQRCVKKMNMCWELLQIYGTLFSLLKSVELNARMKAVWFIGEFSLVFLIGFLGICCPRNRHNSCLYTEVLCFS